MKEISKFLFPRIHPPGIETENSGLARVGAARERSPEWRARRNAQILDDEGALPVLGSSQILKHRSQILPILHPKLNTKIRGTVSPGSWLAREN